MPHRLRPANVLLLAADDSVAIEVQSAFGRLGLSGLMLGSSPDEVSAALTGGPIQLAIVHLDMPRAGEIVAVLDAAAVPIVGIADATSSGHRVPLLERPIDSHRLAEAIGTIPILSSPPP